MTAYEFRVIPAPRRGLKGKGVGSGGDERFAHALETAMNEMGRAGWDYVRADTLPCEERQGLTGRTTIYHNVLVFRRALVADAIQTSAEPAPLPLIAAPAPLPTVPAPALRLADPLPPAPPLGPAGRVAAE